MEDMMTYYRLWAMRVSILIVVLLISLPMFSCGDQPKTCKKDGVPVTEEEFVEEVQAVYEDMLTELKQLSYYGSPLTYSDDPQELMDEETMRERSDEEWRQLYEEKKEFYWKVHSIYADALDRLGSLIPSKEYSEATVTLCLVIEMIWTWAHSEFSIYDLCLQKGLRKYEWRSSKDEPGYSAYEGLLQLQEDSRKLIEEICTSESEDGWQEVLDKFDFIEIQRFFETS